MSREYKFRAWLHDDLDISNGFMYYNVYPMLNNEFYFDGDVADIDECTELMQFTGLKDKKGNDIFEGDILRELLMKGEKYIEFIDIVIFGKGSFLLEGKKGDITQLILFNDECEIIGNIYETPELLK